LQHQHERYQFEQSNAAALPFGMQETEQTFQKTPKCCHPQHNGISYGNKWEPKTGSFEPENGTHQRPHIITRTCSTIASVRSPSTEQHFFGEDSCIW
jgi:hypothetical protein